MKSLLALIWALLKLAILAAVVLAAWYGYHTWRGAGDDRPQFRTLAVARGDIAKGATATGNLKACGETDVVAQIAGVVKSFGPDRDRPKESVDANSHVKEGDVLVQLDDRNQRIEVERATVGVLFAEAQVQESQAHWHQADLNFKRAERLKDTNSIAEFENAKMQFDLAEAELAMSKAKLAQAKIAEKQAALNLSYTTIRAPIDGTVIARRAGIGQVNPASVFLLAADLGHMVIEAAVNEADIGEVQVGQKVTFTVDAYRDRTFVGKVSQIHLDAAMSANVVTYNVLVDVENLDGALKPGETAKVLFEVARRSDVLKVPDQALRWRPTWEQITPSARAGLVKPPPRKSKEGEGDDDPDADEPTVEIRDPTVWVRADDGLVRPVPVKLGLSDNMHTEMVSGNLRAKDEIVIGAIRPAKPDFVSSFINKIVKK